MSPSFNDLHTEVAVVGDPNIWGDVGNRKPPIAYGASYKEKMRKYCTSHCLKRRDSKSDQFQLTFPPNSNKTTIDLI